MQQTMLLLLAPLLISGLLSGCATRGSAPPSEAAGEPEIAFTQYVLDNGLTLIVHEDHKAPIVAVNVWYHVGSKNEKPGKTGFAHLFEHLMFNGSENFNDDYFGPFEGVGATDMNGTTNADRTNYFQNVPSSSLDLALWMESDRMGHLLGAIDQERLDEQRGVVQNEKRQGDNQPYGRVFDFIDENAYPEGHPYSWPTIGSMEDLDAASLEDVKEWFRGYYGAANAVIVVAGDVEAAAVREKVEAYFGDIPSGPPVSHRKRWIAERQAEKRQVIQDRVPQARIVKVWNIPEVGSADGDYLDLVSNVLADGKSSRLYRRLVYQDRSATDIAAFAWLRELGGLFVVWATVKPGGDLAEVERAIDEEMARLRAEGPSRDELARARMRYRADFIRGVERIGGFGGKSDVLARSQVYAGRPDAYRESLARVAAASEEDLQAAAQRWLHDGVYALEVRPFPEYASKPDGVDRSKLPASGAPPAVEFPTLERATLSGGLEVVLARRDAVPVVDFNLLVDAGYAADRQTPLEAGRVGVPGTATLALDMLDQGTRSRSALEIGESLARLGAEFSAGSSLDMSSVRMSVLREYLDPSLELYADLILEPAFAEEDVERLRTQQLAQIQREKATPMKMALRVFPPLLYGEDHAYGVPFTGSGEEESVAKLTAADLRAFHASWFKPDNATLVVVGDTTLAEIVPKLESLFGSWSPGPVPDKELARVAAQPRSRVYLIDRPGAPQSVVFAGHLAPPKANPEEAALQILNEILGGSFTSRINMNLREDKHWSYGAHSFLYDARGQRPFIVYSSVQTDKTAPALAEIQQELAGIAGPHPPTQDEVAHAKDRKTLSLPGRWETSKAVAGSVSSIVRFGFPDDYWQRYPEALRAVDRAQAEQAGRGLLRPDALTWVVVGDLEKIGDEVRALGLGEAQVIDAEGRPVGE
ncbi:MAG: insulinase family protein [Deltaproteobacteria bacterium]|nr:insulinase family protein [Deltaproteobacteria bacterium]